MPELAGDVGGVARGVGVVVDPRRPAGLEAPAWPRSARRGATGYRRASGGRRCCSTRRRRVAVPSGSYRIMPAWSAPSSRPTSSVTAANTSSGGAARATSVATRRSAACSSAKPRSSTRAWALAIAVATSSVNPASRASVSAGSDCSRADARLMTPHSRPSTLIGTPIAEHGCPPRGRTRRSRPRRRRSRRGGPPGLLEHQRGARSARRGASGCRPGSAGARCCSTRRRPCDRVRRGRTGSSAADSTASSRPASSTTARTPPPGGTAARPAPPPAAARPAPRRSGAPGVGPASQPSHRVHRLRLPVRRRLSSWTSHPGQRRGSRCGAAASGF